MKLLLSVQENGGIWGSLGPTSEYSEVKKECVKQLILLGLAHPYVLHELLAVAALHLSTLEVEKQRFYRYHATELQMHAISLFNKESRDGTPDPVASFFFAAVLGSHNLYDAMTADTDDFGRFLDKFVRYLGVARGVTTLMDSPTWTVLQNETFAAMFESSNEIPDSETAVAPELESLEDHLRAADISPASLKVYEEVLKSLKAAFQAHRTAEGGRRVVTISAIFSIPIRLSSEYTNLLAQRRPEALAILAHFGALLHMYREVWLFGNGGRGLIEAIAKFLGTYWDSWLELPRRILEL